MITLAYEQKNYDVEYQDDLYNFELRSYDNMGYDDMTVYLDGNDVTDDPKTQEVIEYFEDNLEAK